MSHMPIIVSVMQQVILRKIPITMLRHIKPEEFLPENKLKERHHSGTPTGHENQLMIFSYDKRFYHSVTGFSETSIIIQHFA